MQYFTTFLSKRNVPLILKHLPEDNNPLLTIENWPAWEEDSIYVVYHDGLVQSILDDKFLNRNYYNLIKTFKKSNTPIFDNKVWNPDFLIDLEKEFGIKWDDISFDLLYGRWMKTLTGEYV